MTMERALRLAWIWWTVFLLTPAALFVVVMWSLVFGEGTTRPMLGQVFFLVSLAWLLLATPGAFLLRHHVYRSYWEGRSVDPESYLKGMITIWIAPEVGGIIALVGVLFSGTLLPNLLPAAVAFMLFAPFWPTGRAMVDTVGAADDDEVFRHPR
ncbi:hypothetical protein ACERK3_04705 [Phycisphaerales bacterium AB-hyl4]|uniref:Uncharacterized protein n=1 Tax=Natronomicrosphaera hydrolytica TaxID=3242702 RepID=A0ABV4U215_9BACT